MDILAGVKSFIYLISSSLLWPTLMLLAILTIYLLFYIGGLVQEFFERLKNNTNDLKSKIKNQQGLSSNVLCFLKELAKLDLSNEADVQFLLQTKTADYAKNLDFIKIMIRIGPALGLIGTLIPMGTGLAGLGQGDMTKLTSDLVIAFTTTVVGLAQGGIAYSIWTVRKRWIDEDIRIIEYAAEILTEDNSDKDEI